MISTEEAAELLKKFIIENLPSEYMYICIVATENQPGKVSYNCDEPFCREILLETAARLEGSFDA